MNMSMGLLTTIALAFGLTVADCKEPPKKKEPFPPKAIIDAVAKLSEELGAEGFKVRRKATKRLLEIANTQKMKDGKSIKPYEGYLWKKMNELTKSSDPEISQRAKEICLKLNPGSYVDVSHLGILKYQLNPGDTLQEVAEIFDSKVEWVKAANPGLNTDKDLQTLKLVKVPVAKDGDWAEAIGSEIEIEKEIEEEIEIEEEF